MSYVVLFVNHKEQTGYLKCDVKKIKPQSHLIFPKNISHFLSKYMLVIINLDKVNMYHDISIAQP